MFMSFQSRNLQYEIRNSEGLHFPSESNKTGSRNKAQGARYAAHGAGVTAQGKRDSSRTGIGDQKFIL
jgi:hypothetical protein